MPNPNPKQYGAGRMAEASRSYKSLSQVARNLQETAYQSIMDWVFENIETKDNQITYTKVNLKRVGGVFEVLRKFNRVFRTEVVSKIIERVDAILDENTRYFQDMPGDFGDVKDLQSRARLQVLLRWGYNGQTGQLLPGGYIESIFEETDVSQRVAGMINRAISGRMTLPQFRKVFRRVFVAKLGKGFIESRFNRATFDLFQRIDRTAQLLYAKELGLSNAIYSGTIIETSRPFPCVESVGKVFTFAEIEAWNDRDWNGKMLIHDPFLDCGGHNCRHHWSYISDEVAEILRSP